MNYTPDIQYAIEVARGAGEVIRSHYRKVERLTKTHIAASDEAVTIADRQAQAYIVRRLRERFPGDGIIGEENEQGDDITVEVPDPTGRVWVIDPIDGTNNFVAGLDYFSVCIGLLVKGYPVGGVVYDVCRDQMYHAAQGQGAFLDQEPIKALTTDLDNRSIVMVTANALDPKGRLPAYTCRWTGLSPWKMRCLGSAALDAALVAAGVAHGAVTVNGKIWDVAAPAAIVLEAGGTITDFDGKDVFPFDLRGYHGAKVPFLAAGPRAKQPLLADMADPRLPKFVP